MNELKKEIKQLIEEINPYEEITDETKLLEEGIINSLAVFEIVIQLEDNYGIEVPDDAYTRENFETISSIAALILGLVEGK